MADLWPDENVTYEFAGIIPNAKAIWQKAVDEALKSGSLSLRHDHRDVFHILGECPRCGHPMAQVVEFGVVRPGGGLALAAGGRGAGQVLAHFPQAPKGMKLPARAEPKTQGNFDLVCSCAQEHAAPDGKKGCGWGAGVPVAIQKPD